MVFGTERKIIRQEKLPQRVGNKKNVQFFNVLLEVSADTTCASNLDWRRGETNRPANKLHVKKVLFQPGARGVFIMLHSNAVGKFTSVNELL